MTVLGSVWQLLGGSWEHFGLLFSRSLEKWPKCKNEQHYSTFGVFLWSWEEFGSYVGRCWLQDDIFHLSWVMLWNLGAKMAHKSARTTQDNHQIIFEVKVMILLSVFDIGAIKTLCFTGVEFLKHCVLQGSEITTSHFIMCF